MITNILSLSMLNYEVEERLHVLESNKI